jgi:hypothetical protein
MIEVHKEPKEMHWATRVYEKCICCKRETDTWHEPTNKPICSVCCVDITYVDGALIYQRPPVVYDPIILFKHKTLNP